MIALYITSIERHTGKDLITMGLIHRLRRDGLRVGYFKAMGRFPIKVDNTVTDKGAWFFHRLFELEDPVELTCPVIITQDLIVQNYNKGVTGLQQKIEAAFKKISEQKDLVVVNCDHNFSEGASFGLSGLQLIKLLGARALFVERYECDFCVDLLLELRNIIGEPMLGVVFNKVNASHMEEIEDLVSPFLHRKEIHVFGALPNDPILGAVHVRELADHLAADVVCGKDKLHALVEDFLVGGMQADKFFTYLLKKPCSAVIVGGDRTDIQLVAIENGVRCLILSGNLYPNEIIIARANAKGVPILVVRDDTYAVAKKVEGMVGTFSLSERQKIDHGIRLVDQAFKFDHLHEQLGFRPS